MIELMVLTKYIERKKEAVQKLSDGNLDDYTLGVLETLYEIEEMMRLTKIK